MPSERRLPLLFINFRIIKMPQILCFSDQSSLRIPQASEYLSEFRSEKHLASSIVYFSFHDPMSHEIFKNLTDFSLSHVCYCMAIAKFRGLSSRGNSPRTVQCCDFLSYFNFPTTYLFTQIPDQGHQNIRLTHIPYLSKCLLQSQCSSTTCGLAVFNFLFLKKETSIIVHISDK